MGCGHYPIGTPTGHRHHQLLVVPLPGATVVRGVAR